VAGRHVLGAQTGISATTQLGRAVPFDTAWLARVATPGSSTVNRGAGFDRDEIVSGLTIGRAGRKGRLGIVSGLTIGRAGRKGRLGIVSSLTIHRAGRKGRLGIVLVVTIGLGGAPAPILLVAGCHWRALASSGKLTS